MLLNIGKRTTSEDAVDLLLECHERIRKFLKMARALGAASGPSDEEVRSVAGQVRRYFAVSLPLHIQDEHEDIARILGGAGDEVASALATMDKQHGEHEPLLARLIEICDALVREPGQLASYTGELSALAARLTDELSHHLEAEERVIFPALRRLPASEREALKAAMRARRGS